MSVLSTDVYESGREKIAKFINAADSSEVVFTRNTTESLNLLAYSYGYEYLKEDDEIVISIMEHHSNLVTWQEVCKKTHAKLKYMYAVSYTHLTLPTISCRCRSRWSPYH